MKNIVLIGMPGSGKTTVSKLLSQQLCLPLIDIDEYIVDKYQQTIEDMFNINEAYFRERETICCQEVGLLDGYVLSTGGGVIKNQVNVDALKQNGVIFLLDRSVENIIQDIETSTRPLLKEGKQKLYTLYEERHELYHQSADVVIDNNKEIVYTLKQIIDYMESIYIDSI